MKGLLLSLALIIMAGGLTVGCKKKSVKKGDLTARTVKRTGGGVLKFGASAFFNDYSSLKGFAAMKKYMGKKVAINGAVLRAFDFGAGGGYQLWLKAGGNNRLVVKFADQGAAAKKKGFKADSPVRVLCNISGKSGLAIHLSSCILK